MSSMACSSGTSVKYCVGDAVVSDDPKRYGVVVGLPGDHLEVQFLVCDPATRVWRVGSEVAHLKFESVCEHVGIFGDDDNAPRAWDQLGFRMLDGSSLVQKCDETAECRRMFPVGDPAFELVSDEEEDEDEIAEEMADFIVPDDECEAWTPAVEDNDFVREMHGSVRWFNKWEPKDERERAVKRGIERLAGVAAHLDDENRFSRGMSAADYNRRDV